jgi:hypothetical protein
MAAPAGSPAVPTSFPSSFSGGPRYAPRAGQYPVYVPDQFLTSNNLNDTSDYLEKEIRATRSYLIGNGVVNGLDQLKANLDSTGTVINSIQVNAGYGLTPDGYLLDTPGFYPTRVNAAAIVFTLAARVTIHMYTNRQNPNDPDDVHRTFVYNDPEIDEFVNPGTGNTWPNVTMWPGTGTPVSCIELYTGASDPNKTVGSSSTPVSSLLSLADLQGYVLAFMADPNNISSSGCGTGSCDDQGVKRKIIGRFLLIPAGADGPLVGTANIAFNSKSHIQIPRLPNLCEIGDLTTHYDNVNQMFATSQTAIGNALNEIRSHVPKLLPNADMNAALKKFNSFDITTVPANLAIYHHHFAKDVHLAVTEYIEKYNEITNKFPDLNDTRIDRVIILGHVFNTNAIDPYRYYFSPALCSCGGHCDTMVLDKHYRRIIAMINSFIYDPQVLTTHMMQVQQGAATTTKVTFSKEPHNPLGDKCIPCYYDMSHNLNPAYSVVAKAPNSVPFYPPVFKDRPAGYTGNTGPNTAVNFDQHNNPLPITEVSIDTQNINNELVPSITCNGMPTQYTGDYNLLTLWKAHSTDVHIEQVNNYYLPPPVQYTTPANDIQPLNTSQYNFVKVEGHYGLPVEDAHAHLVDHYTKHDVPIQIVHATAPDVFTSLFPAVPPGSPGLIGAVPTYNLNDPRFRGVQSHGGAFLGGAHVLINDGHHVIHCATTLSRVAL